MLTNNFLFKNFKKKKNRKKIQIYLKNLITSKNEVINSLTQNYKYSYSKKLIRKYKKFKFIRIFGMGGSSLGSHAIYDFLKHKIGKNFFFISNLNNVEKFPKKNFLNLIISKSGNTLETIANSNVYIKKNDKNILITENKKIRNYGLYGVWGSSTNITDGRYTYFRYPDDMTEQEINQYTLMPTHITSFFTDEELKSAKLEKPFNFTKGIPLLKIKGSAKTPLYRKLGWKFFKDTETVLFDILNDPEQNIPIVNEKIEKGGFLGVSCEEREEGLVIQSIVPNSAAEQAGLRQGDILLRINNQPIVNREKLTILISTKDVSEKVVIRYKRENKAHDLSLRLGSRLE